MIAIAFLGAGILRVAILAFGRVSRSELDYHLSLESTNDLFRELCGIDEVSRALGCKSKRRLMDMRYVLPILICALTVIAITFLIPIFTANVPDQDIPTDAVNIIDEVAYWAGTGTTHKIDMSKCLNPRAFWMPAGSQCVACRTEDYEVGVCDNLNEKANRLEREVRIGELSCLTCYVKIGLTRRALFKVNEGYVLTGPDGHDDANVFQIEMNANKSSSETKMIDCSDETKILSQKQVDDWFWPSSPDPSKCYSAVFADPESSPTLQRGVLIVSLSASAEDTEMVVYETGERQMASILASARRGDVRSTVLEMSKKISYKKLRKESLEYQLHEGRSKGFVPRKVISTSLIAGLFGILVPLYFIAKAYELIKFGSESDRSKFRRTLTALKNLEMNGASSYELRGIIGRRLIVVEEETSRHLEYEIERRRGAKWKQDGDTTTTSFTEKY